MQHNPYQQSEIIAEKLSDNKKTIDDLSTMFIKLFNQYQEIQSIQSNIKNITTNQLNFIVDEQENILIKKSQGSQHEIAEDFLSEKLKKINKAKHQKNAQLSDVKNKLISLNNQKQDLEAKKLFTEQKQKQQLLRESIFEKISQAKKNRCDKIDRIIKIVEFTQKHQNDDDISTHVAGQIVTTIKADYQTLIRQYEMLNQKLQKDLQMQKRNQEKEEQLLKDHERIKMVLQQKTREIQFTEEKINIAIQPQVLRELRQKRQILIGQEKMLRIKIFEIEQLMQKVNQE